MGNSNGNLHYYWNEIWNDEIPRFQGAFIWDMIDQGLRVPNKENGWGFHYAYGGDFGDKINDLQFCINGMFSPDRDPHPAVSEIKYLQQPVVFVPMCDDDLLSQSKKSVIRVLVDGKSKASIELLVLNRYSFRDLSHLTWSWDLVSNRDTVPIRSSSFRLPRLDNGDGTVRIDLVETLSRVAHLERARPNGGNSFFINIRGSLKSRETWAPTGHLLVRQQLPVEFIFHPIIHRTIVPTARPKRQMKLHAKKTDGYIEVWATEGKDASRLLLKVERKTAGIVEYAPHGKNILQSAIVPNFTRASTDNDNGGLEMALKALFPFIDLSGLLGRIKGFGHFSHASNWRWFGVSQDDPPVVACTQSRVSQSEDQVDLVLLCSVVCRVRRVAIFKLGIHCSIHSDGQVRIENHVVPQKALRGLPSLPRVGMRFSLDREMHDVQYYGRGPDENYPDRKSGSHFGVFDTTAARMGYSQYIVPGESGSRSDCQWAAFRSRDGSGVCATMEKNGQARHPFSFSALLDSPEELHSASHMMPKRQNGDRPVHVNIDYRLMGLGGDNSWQPVVYPEFLVPPKSFFQYSLLLTPLKRGDDASFLASDL